MLPLRATRRWLLRLMCGVLVLVITFTITRITDISRYQDWTNTILTHPRLSAKLPEPSPLQTESGPGPALTLLLAAYPRTGSSYLGSLLSSFKGATYLYEPLAYLPKILELSNTRKLPPERLRRVVQQLFLCRYRKLWPIFSNVPNTIIFKPHIQDNSEASVLGAAGACLRAHHRVIKLVRARLSQVTYLLHPDAWITHTNNTSKHPHNSSTHTHNTAHTRNIRKNKNNISNNQQNQTHKYFPSNNRISNNQQSQSNINIYRSKYNNSRRINISGKLDSSIGNAAYNSHKHLQSTIRIKHKLHHNILSDPSANIKIIYLVRDPRAILTSIYERKEEFICERKSPQILCEAMIEDLAALKALGQERRKVKVVRYEDMVANRVRSTQELFSFINLPMTKEVEEFLLKHSEDHPEAANRTEYYSTFKRFNKPIDRWRSQLPEDVKKNVEINCLPVLKEFGYIDNMLV